MLDEGQGEQGIYTEEEQKQFIDELPGIFDYTEAYSLLHTYLKTFQFKDVSAMALLLYIKENILKIPRANNNPYVGILLENAIEKSLLEMKYFSPKVILLDLVKGISILKKSLKED